VRRVRVGLIIGQLTVGGAEGQLWELVRHLDRHFEPIVYCLVGGGVAPTQHDLEGAGVSVRVVAQRGLGRARRLAQLLQADGVDVVHAWLFIANSYALGARVYGARQPLITSARNCKVQGRLSQLMNIAAFRASRAIVVNSHDVATYIGRQYWAPPARIHVIHNGVDTERFHPAVALPADATIVTVGRMVRQKNHEMFLRAAAALGRELPQVRFVIVGDGPLRGSLETLARQLGLFERVRFVGERRDVETILRGATLFWLTSHWEGMPNVVLEAMASGLPVIATDVGGTRELIRSGIEGFIVSDGDAEAFVKHSRALLTDDGQRARCSTAARQRAATFSTSRMATALGALYDAVFNRGQ